MKNLKLNRCLQMKPKRKFILGDLPYGLNHTVRNEQVITAKYFHLIINKTNELMQPKFNSLK